MCLVLEGLIGHHRTVKPASLALVVGSIDLDYCDVEWFAGIKGDHSVISEIAPKYCILDLLTMRATPFFLKDSCPQ